MIRITARCFVLPYEAPTRALKLDKDVSINTFKEKYSNSLKICFFKWCEV